MRKYLPGFTLIELLIVIAILAVLATFFIGNFGGAGAKARDAERKSDLKQYQSSLTSFAGLKKGFYPSWTTGNGVTANVTLCGSLNAVFEPDIVCTNDPKAGAPAYRYQSNGSNGGTIDATLWFVWATLETKEGANTYYWVVCSTGNSGKIINTINLNLTGTCPSGLVQ